MAAMPVIIHPITGLNSSRQSEFLSFREKNLRMAKYRDSQTSNQECPVGDGHEFMKSSHGAHLVTVYGTNTSSGL